MKHILLLHGALGTAKQLEPLAKHLSDKYLVHTLTFSGHGGDTPPNKYLFEHFRKDIIDYLDKAGLQQVDVFGYSMGGYAALFASLHHPGRFGKIATLGTKLLWTAEGAAREVQMLDPDKIAAKVPAFAAHLQNLHGADNWKAVLQATANMMLHLGEHPAIAPDTFKDINLPVLLAIGDRDKTAGLDDTLTIYRQLPDARLWVLPTTPHPLEQVDAAALAEGLVKFWGL